MKINTFLLRLISLILSSYCVSNCVMGQKVNLDTLNFEQVDHYRLKADRLRKTGKIITLSGIGAGVTGGIIGAVLMSIEVPENPYPGLAGAYIMMLGVTVGVPAAIVGIPLWAVGNSRTAKAELTLRKFTLQPEKSMQLGVGITISF